MIGFLSDGAVGFEISLEVILYCARNVLLINYTRFFLTGKVEMKVCKFGGSSLADARQLTKVIDIVLADPQRRIVVVSAPGKRNGSDTKVTDLLIGLAEAALANENTDAKFAAVLDRYASIAKDLNLGDAIMAEIEADIDARLATPKADAGIFMDTLKAAGEDNSAKLAAVAFAARGVKARYVSPRETGMMLEGESGNAQLVEESYRKLFEGIFNYQGVIEFPEKAVTADQIEDLINFVLKTGSVLDLPGSRYEVFVDNEQFVTKVSLSYNHSFKEGAVMYDTLMKRVDEIVKEAEPLLSEYDKIKYFHDTIINGCVYDDTAPDIHTAYGVLCGGRGVCDGYVKAFQLLCEKANIAAIPVYGKVLDDPSATEDHMWNKVRCDGEWYNIDVTWDDPRGDEQVLRYDYFLIDDATAGRGLEQGQNSFMNIPAATNANGDYYSRNDLIIGYNGDVNGQFESLITAQMTDLWTDIAVDFRCEDKGIYDSIMQTYFTEQADGSKGFGNFLQEYMAPGEALRYTFTNSDSLYSYHITVSRG